METEHTQVNNGDKLYIVTRQDLRPGSQIAQALHAFREFIADHSELENDWYKNSNYIAILAAKNEEELVKLIQRMEKKKIRFSVFREPDLDNEITAVAIEPGDKGRRVTSCFPLALKNCGVSND